MAQSRTSLQTLFNMLAYRASSADEVARWINTLNASGMLEGIDTQPTPDTLAQVAQ